MKKLNRREVMEGAAASVAAAVLPESPVVAAATAPLMRRQPLGSGREIGRWVTYPGTSLAPDYLLWPWAIAELRARAKADGEWLRQKFAQMREMSEEQRR